MKSSRIVQRIVLTLFYSYNNDLRLTHIQGSTSLNGLAYVSYGGLFSCLVSPTPDHKRNPICLIWETVYSLGKKTFPSHDNKFYLK